MYEISNLEHSSNILNLIVCDKNNIVITELDIKIYQQLYKQNYNLDINKSNSLKDLVLIYNLINNLESNNPEFLKKVDSEILMRLGQNSFENDGIKNFLRFSRIRDEFVINYFQNKLEIIELINLFKDLGSLELPISNNDCLIINEIVDLRDNENFVENFYDNLKNNTQNFQIMINNIEYKVCINELIYRNIEDLIVECIQIQTAKEFEKFVYEKSENEKLVFLGDLDSINIELVIKSFDFLKHKVKYILICNKRFSQKYSF